MDKVQVNIDGKIHSATKGSKLKDLLNISMPCGGHGRCGNCKVYAKGFLSEPSIPERNHLSQDELKSGIRLACMTSVEGDCQIQTIKKDFMPSLRISWKV